MAITPISPLTTATDVPINAVLDWDGDDSQADGFYLLVSPSGVTGTSIGGGGSRYDGNYRSRYSSPGGYIDSRR